MGLTQVSTDGVKDGSLLNADINASAAIAKSKIENLINNNADNRVITGSGTANTLNGESNVVIDASGRLGIATASPTAKLHIVESASTTAQIIKSGTSSNQNVHIKLLNDNEAGELVFGVFGSAASTFGNITAGDGIVSSNQELCLNSQNSSGSIKFGIGSTPNEKIRIDSSGRVGIGTASPDTLVHVKNTSAAPLQRFESSSYSSFIGTAQANDNAGNGSKAGNLVLRGQTGVAIMGNNGTTTQVKIDADGLKFGTDTAAANALDDYEEGTFTLSASGGGSSFTSTVSRYIKIGRVVHIFLQLDSFSGGSSSTDLVLNGLPFTSSSSNNSAAVIHTNKPLISNGAIFQIAGNTSSANVRTQFASDGIKQSNFNGYGISLNATYVAG